MENRPENTRDSRLAAFLLLAAMLGVFSLRAADRWGGAAGDVDDPQSAEEWLQRAAAREAADDLEAAERACRAALAQVPLHPEAARRLTGILLKRGDRAPLYEWMDDLVLGDARLAERFFDLSDFAPWMADEQFRALHREAVIQAND